MTTDQKLLPARSSPKMVFLDEAGYLLGNNDDQLKVPAETRW